jgi:hypothetical protein
MFPLQFWTNPNAFPPKAKVTKYTCTSNNLNKDKAYYGIRQTGIDHDNDCISKCTLIDFNNGLSAIVFEKDNCKHNCTGYNTHLQRLSTYQRQLLAGLVKTTGSIDSLYEKVIVPKQLEATNISRMSMLTKSQLKRTLGPLINDGSMSSIEDDISSGYDRAKVMQDKGYAVIYKIAGYSASDKEHCIVPEELHDLFNSEDLLIAHMSPEQKALLEFTSNKWIATDGSHDVVIYSKLKGIVVMVETYSEDDPLPYEDRSFPVLWALAGSENGHIHSIICKFLKLMVPSLSPRFLMSDMSCTAYNGYKDSFPEMDWFWCKYHLLNAFFKNLNQTSNPKGLFPEVWKDIKKAIKAELYLIANPDNEKCQFSYSECRDRLIKVIEVLEKAEAMELAMYLKKRLDEMVHWSMEARYKALHEKFQYDSMPKMLNTNNCTETLFRVLKHDLLGDTPATICTWLEKTYAYNARLKSNLYRARVLPYLSIRTDIQRPMTNVFDPEYDYMWSKALYNNEDPDEDIFNIEVPFMIQKGAKSIDSVLELFNNKEPFVTSNLLYNETHTTTSGTTYSIQLKKKRTYGFTKESVELFKVKQESKNKHFKEDFKDNSDVFDKFLQRDKKELFHPNKLAFEATPFTALKEALKCQSTNTVRKIVSIAYEFIKVKLPESIKKNDLIDRFLMEIHKMLIWDPDVAAKIGDIGIFLEDYKVMTNSSSSGNKIIPSGSKVFFQINGMNNAGVNVTNSEELLRGYALHEGQLVYLPVIIRSCTKMARFGEHMRNDKMV